jgi:hypothetical protein
MERFARRTGLDPRGPERRYLWTDAFAVCNYLTLLRRTGEPRFGELARLLIDRVHHVLGRHRGDDARRGWISGLSDAEGEAHPTGGGLRIGKELPERRPGEPYDPVSEWDREGQYYHYLVRWMHALSRASAVLGEPDYHRWAVELAAAAHRGFAHVAFSGGPVMLYWKMSIDLTRPTVPSQGAHDPLDGLVTLSGLSAHSERAGALPLPALGPAIRGLLRMARERDWVTEDPLGVGGLLTDLWWLAQLLGTQRTGSPSLDPLFGPLLGASLASLEAFARTGLLRHPPAQRLAFRELGLAAGLSASSALLESMAGLRPPAHTAGLEDLERYLPLAGTIVDTWLAPPAQLAVSWRAHEDINDVMLATAILPDEYLRV